MCNYSFLSPPSSTVQLLLIKCFQSINFTQMWLRTRMWMISILWPKRVGHWCGILPCTNCDIWLVNVTGFPRHGDKNICLSAKELLVRRSAYVACLSHFVCCWWGCLNVLDWEQFGSLITGQLPWIVLIAICGDSRSIVYNHSNSQSWIAWDVEMRSLQ